MESKISIITVCFNCEGLIERTIKSVIEQTYTNTQYIIIDGGSTDDTLNVIKRYEDSIDVLLSEIDNGIYDAMNKGLNYATGDLVYFLNAGDYLCNNDVLRNVIEKLSLNPEIDILHGDYIYYDDISEQRYSGYRAGIPDFIRRGCCHQAIFAKRSTFAKCGKFNTDYKIFADFDWLLRVLVKFDQKISYIGIPIAYYLKGGKSENHGGRYNYERIEIIQKNIDALWLVRFALSYPKSFCAYLLKLSKYKILNHIPTENELSGDPVTSGGDSDP